LEIVMTIPLWSLLIGAVLPYVWHFASFPYKAKQFGSVDIGAPRVQGENLEDVGARVWGAQMNAWEALTVFGVANLAAFMAGLDPEGNWSIAAMIWVAARVLHGVFYVAGIGMVRMLCFTVAYGVSLWIMVMAAMA
jgi:uncharacterized MAPEG superfamily protein